MDKLNKIKDEITGLLAVISGVVLFISLISHSAFDPSPFTSTEWTKSKNLLGPFGAYLSDTLLQVIGFSAYLLPVLFGVYGIKRLLLRQKKPKLIVIAGIIFLLFSLSPLFSLFFNEMAGFPSGGVTGEIVITYTLKFFSFTGSLLIFLSILIITLMFLLPFSIVDFSKKSLQKTSSLKAKIKKRKEEKKVHSQSLLIENRDNEEIEEILEEEDIEEVEPHIQEVAISQHSAVIEDVPQITTYNEQPWQNETGEYQIPSLELLSDPSLLREIPSKDELISKSRLLEKKLSDFDIVGRVTQVYPGPVVAMFEFEPAPGVKINKIVSLSDDLALTMKATSVRVSPIPGKAALGIEVPNKMKEDVFLKEILSSNLFATHHSKLILALGKDIFGNPVVTDLARMPHLLVAGATGSGKSVAMNSMVLSLLYRATPKEVKMLMIDPKLLELSIYNDIPHLLLPVITTPKGAAEALKRMVLEMEYRYKLLADKGARNIDSFNSKIESEEEFMPYIVIFIDELADLMLVSKREVEEPIARIAQMARAAGIHMILATQRPSVDVITGVIKANFPSRISFQVSSKVDSRTILDTMGAEKLLGKGDMLFVTPGSKIMRVHGAYVSEDEINKIVDIIRQQERPDYAAFQTVSHNNTMIEESGKEGRDELYKKALEIVISTEQASISYIQRRLKIGYNRAARIIEMMEEDGIVGPPVEAGKPREVLKGGIK